MWLTKSSGVPLHSFPLLAACAIAGAVGLLLGIWWPFLRVAAGSCADPTVVLPFLFARSCVLNVFECHTELPQQVGRSRLAGAAIRLPPAGLLMEGHLAQNPVRVILSAGTLSQCATTLAQTCARAHNDSLGAFFQSGRNEWRLSIPQPTLFAAQGF